jgi:hypothetical protein
MLGEVEKILRLFDRHKQCIVKLGLAIMLLNMKRSQAWLCIIKCNMMNVNICNLHLIHTIQQAKCFHNIGSTGLCKACFSSDSGYPSKSYKIED